MTFNQFLKGLAVAILAIAVLILGMGLILISTLQESTRRALEPVNSVSGYLSTQVNYVLNPTPTILPDPVTIIHDVRSLARLETVQYSVEKVITAESGQGELAFLFGDRLLFVAHGTVIAGIDLEKLKPEDMWVKNNVLHVRLPEPEVFVTTLSNTLSYVYDRDTGILRSADMELESLARQAADAEIYKAALDDGILERARDNAENYLSRLLIGLGYPEVIFES